MKKERVGDTMDNKITAQVQMLGGFRLTVGGSSITSKAQQAKNPGTSWNT